ncbi:MAG: U32 family peptidase [Negativicutes bacterium]|jgi:putative protease
MNKVELLAPAGNLEKLKFACLFGADAVYIGGKQFGLRAYSDNFNDADFIEGLAFAHSMEKLVYVTVNAYLRNNELEELPEYLRKLESFGVDAIIVADPGVMLIARSVTPNLPIHISTQANTVNYAAVELWQQLGAERVVMARELTLDEITVICAKTTMNIECFVHGAMCVSYSGRCLLSNYLTGRDSNRGGCTQPCRWKYSLVEEQRPGQYFPVTEDERGTYIFNSRDLCMIEHIPALINSGIYSFKIEGRMKSAYYVATVTNAYRRAIDAYYNGKYDDAFAVQLLSELNKISHREYSNGFYFDNPGAAGQIYDNSSYQQSHDFVGIVLNYDITSGFATIEQRNNIKRGETVEFFQPNGPTFSQTLLEMYDDIGQPIHVAPHPQQIFTVRVEHSVEPNTLMRRAL